MHINILYEKLMYALKANRTEGAERMFTRSIQHKTVFKITAE